MTTNMTTDNDLERMINEASMAVALTKAIAASPHAQQVLADAAVRNAQAELDRLAVEVAASVLRHPLGGAR